MAGRRARVLLRAGLVMTALLGTGLVAPTGAMADAAGPAISGLLSDAATGASVPGACVELIEATGVDRQRVGYGCADAVGRYTVSGDVPAGTWLVRAYQTTGQHAAVVSEPVTVVQGRPVPAIDVALPPAATLTGRVVDGRTGSPIMGACPAAWFGRTQEQPYMQVTDCSDANGDWTLTGLPAGRLSLSVGGDAEHVGRWAPAAENQSTASLFTTTAGATTRTGTLREQHGATLTGRITDRGGHPVPNAWVLLGNDTAMRMGAGYDQYTAQTDVEGRYTISNIAPQQHSVLVETSDASGLAWQWSGGKGDPATATRLALRYERTTRFDATLDPEAVLTVTADPSGNDSLMVDVQTLSGAYVGYHTEIPRGPGAGRAVVHGLPAGKVVVRLTPVAGPAYWYDHASTRAAATPVPLTAGRTTTVTVTAP